jgi:hypothetical protein
MAKHIFVTGGVVSSLGKGITTAALGMLLKRMGLHVRCQKLDPYINVDPGTMNPYEHGEVYVTEDGAETDLDLGHYERFTDIDLTAASNMTSGHIYSAVIAKERRGDFLGQCVQIIPHVTDEIKRRIRELGQKSRVNTLIVECGGTVGDIEGLPFLEAFRQMRLEEGVANTLFIHVTLAPQLDVVGEQPQQRRVLAAPAPVVVLAARPPGGQLGVLAEQPLQRVGPAGVEGQRVAAEECVGGVGQTREVGVEAGVVGRGRGGRSRGGFAHRARRGGPGLCGAPGARRRRAPTKDCRGQHRRGQQRRTAREPRARAHRPSPPPAANTAGSIPWLMR